MSVFPDSYNFGVFKSSVSRLHLGKWAPSSTSGEVMVNQELTKSRSTDVMLEFEANADMIGIVGRPAKPVRP